VYVAKNGRQWSEVCPNLQGRCDVIRKAPGPTRLAKSGLDSVETALDLFQDMSIKEGSRLFGDNWKEIDRMELLWTVDSCRCLSFQW
jgi:hypothetical protein